MPRILSARTGPRRTGYALVLGLVSVDRDGIVEPIETGQREIYIQPYPGPGGQETVSVGGGREPVWATNGELFYRNLAGDRVMAVSVTTEPTLTMGTSREVLQGNYVFDSIHPQYDVTADGQRFLMLQDAATENSGEAGPPPINTVLNWFEELKERVPVP